MLTRARPLAAVVAFALAVAVLAVFAAKSDDHRLVKLPVASLGGGAADEAATGQAGLAPSRPALAYAPASDYRVEGTLPDLPATAPAYRLGSATTAGAVQKLAESLGVEGDVKAEPHAWIVGDGQRELRVERFAGLPWSLGQACDESPVKSQNGESIVTCSGTAVATQVGRGSLPVTVATAATATATAPTGDCPADAECVVPDPGVGAAPIPVPTTAIDGGPASSPVARPSPSCPPGAACLTAPAAPCKVADGPCGQGIAPVCSPDATCIEPSPPTPALPPGPPPGAEPATPPSPGDLPVFEPPVQPPRPPDLPSRQEAERIARDAFARLGVATDGFQLDDGWLTWEARVQSRVDGLPVIGLGTSLSVGAKGEIVRANGFLALPDRIGDYPLVGVAAGLKRLSTGFGSGPGPRPLIATDDTAVPFAAREPAIILCGGDPPPSCPPPTTVPAELAPPTQVITGVHLALLQLGDALVPAYAFELAGGGGPIPVPAVTDEWLDQQATTLKD